ncbi:NAD(P)H-hydrate dehydratase [Phaeovibrio sulfidiphilus]|uniref:Bifunctional NAD(P)H-hydrate repair enzyme n=1 Tax=Phaeovibrio sulfidiphilus TaxID=1220600 RepID=A0A8J6YNU0_9PROT|nr:NAD(P)H-hydrate dehydratase [Phaeovibrio sulfidiphilus]MBE1236791.1 NAD(P)H-hydrate dehydratase [Phaeovibrio sulfidiphilus]
MKRPAFAPFDTSRPLLTSREMALAEDLASRTCGLSPASMMDRAGFGAAVLIAQRFSRRPVAVLQGPGNNGGDGLVVARELARRGWPVRVLSLGEVRSPAAREMARRWTGPTLPLTPEALDPDDLVVDALFGAGLSRDLSGVALDVVRALDRSGADCVALDMPSGVEGDTGAVRGHAPRCRLTVTFAQPRPGHVLYPGRGLCGEVCVVDIGIPDALVSQVRPNTFYNAPGLWAVPVQGPDRHKYTRGHATIIAGPMTGAARLAARAARRVGAGLVTLAGEEAIRAPLAGDEPGALIRTLEGARPFAELLEDPRRTGFLHGPGRGRSDRTAAEALFLARSGLSLVLDADALSSLEGRSSELARALRGGCVITPHEGEFRRLFAGPEGLAVLSARGRLEQARRAANALGAVVVLKGPDTVIAAPDGRAALSGNAPPSLATAGSGDVLSGLVVGLLARGLAPFCAACAGVWLHGEAACAAPSGVALIAEDLPDALPSVLNRGGF